MSRADYEGTTPRDMQAPGCRVPHNLLVQLFPDETISTCSNLIKFLGSAVSALASSPSPMSDADGDAIDHMCMLIGDALDYEVLRSATERNPTDEGASHE